MTTEPLDHDEYERSPMRHHGEPQAGYDDGPEPEGEVLHFDVEEDRSRGPATRFQIGDDDTVLLARRPKGALIMKLYRLAESKDDMQQLQTIDLFIDSVLDAESAEYLRDRFEDPDDDWDYDVLTPIIRKLTEAWFGRPTTPSRGPSQRRSRSGRRSTVRSRSGG